MLYKRNCPKCGEEIIYSGKYAKIRAEKCNTKCNPCAKIGKIRSEKTKRKMSESKKGKNNPMYGMIMENHHNYGKSNYDMWLEKYGKEEADKRQKISNEKNSKANSGEKNGMYGKNHTIETRKIQRLNMIKRIENKYGQISPNYNSKGCKIIDEYNEKYGFNFCHAENGGEVCIDGYYPDGIDEKRKTIIEIDERQHFDVNGNLKQRDIERQNYLENNGYKVIRIKI